LIENKGEFVMKKLLALLLVLGMASMSQAAFVLSVGGEPAPDEITLLGPSSTLELDIHLLADNMLFNGGDLAIQLSNAQGTLNYSGLTFPKATTVTKGMNPGIWILHDDQGLAGGYATVPGLSNPQNVVITGGDITVNAKNNSVDEGPWNGGYIPKVFANSYPILMQGLMFHCEEPTDVTISLLAAGQGITRLDFDFQTGALLGQTTLYPAGTVLDSIVVHQVIPEPMTMSLLGLGGLALLRRRRA
jgi:hypothetical protein